MSEGVGVPAWFADVFERELEPWVRLSPKQITLLYTHYVLLERWNQRVNLTSLRPGVEMVVRHYCESLFLGNHLPASEGARIVDIGSGAGFPGVPMAVLRPAWSMTLVDSVQRKAVFLRESTRGLKNVVVLAQRAELVRERFDWLVSRAVNPAAVLKNIPRLAAEVGLLLGEASLAVLEMFPQIAWREPVRLPWGDRRFCAIGRAIVPRET
ncbi:MAG TPA: 16S rRNA (guanine(527)-N(7))-methyltransferase RsmG [Bryobacteraceae bacterium]|nr:16S rRNA (guanine(527)-N(7))-methyltransferase RsmG [Bryobacteraceae bacterium]